MKISKNKSRRGITLTETVIGIAIITLISAATLTLMLSQAKMRRKTVEVMEAAAIAENALECYAHAGESKFFELLNNVYTFGGEEKFGEELTIKGTNTKVTFNKDEKNEKFEVTVEHDSTEITRSIPE